MKSSEPMSSTFCSLCDRVSVVDQWNFGRTMLWLSTDSSIPLFEVEPMLVQRDV